VLLLVGNHQLRTIANPAGNYATVYTLAAAQSSTNRPRGVTWEYGWGVTLYGLLQVKNVTGATNLENFVLNHNLILARYYSWLMSVKTSVTNATAGEINSFLTSFIYNPALYTFFTLDRLDYCGSATASLLQGAMFHAATFTNEHALMAQTTANWIAGGGQARLPDGTLWRPERFTGTIWLDDLYMSCPFLVRWYRYTGDTNHLDDAVRQVTNMAGYLQDTNGIWYHGFVVVSNTVNGYKWGRANGWSLVTQAELLSVLPTNHPARSNLLSIFTRHVEGLKTVQAPSGMWRQVLDEPALWEETSCTAMFAYAIARGVNRGWLNPTNMAVARKAFAAVCKNISATGVISNICVGTSIGFDLDFYATRGRANDDHRGVGAVMLTGAEILLNPKLNLSVSNQQAAVSWNAGTAGALELSTNLADWTNFSGILTINSNWQSVATNLIADASFFRLRMPQPGPLPTSLEFEAENLSFTTNGATASLSSSDTNASGNYFITFNGDGVGDFIEFTITNVPAGSYRLKLAFKANNNRARMNFIVDGVARGSPLDQYWPSAFYPLADFGVATFAATGDHTIRLTTTGKNGASSGYTLTADRFILAPE
jgi:unsaturated rhamnogalacturonyl hydrolase